MLENKKNVLFDMDGLLIDSEALGIKIGTLTVAEPLILKNVDYNVIFLSNF